MEYSTLVVLENEYKKIFLRLTTRFMQVDQRKKWEI